MAILKVDYANAVPSTAHKVYDVKVHADDSTSLADVYLQDKTTYIVEGDPFGAADINETNTQVNENTAAIASIGTVLQFYQGTTAPEGTVAGVPFSKIWIDTSTTPFMIKLWDGVQWQIMNTWQ